MELQQLKYFKTVAEIGKICEAAESLFISPPALSTSISRLEKELGFPLFDRTNNKIVLNHQGHIFLKYVAQLFLSLESGINEMQQSLHNKESHITMQCVDTGAWVNLISAFTSEYPNINLLCSTTSLKKLTDSGIPSQQCFIMASDLEIPSDLAETLESMVLFEICTGVMLHKDHPLAGKNSVTLKELAKEKVFMPAQGSGFYSRLLQIYQYYDLPCPTDNAYSLLARQQMISKNLGISFAGIFSDKNYQPHINYIPLEDPLGPWKTRMYWIRNRQFSKDELLFKKFVETYYFQH